MGVRDMSLASTADNGIENGVRAVTLLMPGAGLTHPLSGTSGK